MLLSPDQLKASQTDISQHNYNLGLSFYVRFSLFKTKTHFAKNIVFFFDLDHIFDDLAIMLRLSVHTRQYKQSHFFCIGAKYTLLW